MANNKDLDNLIVGATYNVKIVPKDTGELNPQQISSFNYQFTVPTTYNGSALKTTNATVQTNYNNNGVIVAGYGGGPTSPSGTMYINETGLHAYDQNGASTVWISSGTGDAYFSGSISSTAGQIGGWTIGANSLYSGSGVQSVGLSTGNPHFYASGDVTTSITNLMINGDFETGTTYNIYTASGLTSNTSNGLYGGPSPYYGKYCLQLTRNAGSASTNQYFINNKALIFSRYYNIPGWVNNYDWTLSFYIKRFSGSTTIPATSTLYYSASTYPAVTSSSTTSFNVTDSWQRVVININTSTSSATHSGVRFQLDTFWFYISLNNAQVGDSVAIDAIVFEPEASATILPALFKVSDSGVTTINSADFNNGSLGPFNFSQNDVTSEQVLSYQNSYNNNYYPTITINPSYRSSWYINSNYVPSLSDINYGYFDYNNQTIKLTSETLYDTYYDYYDSSQVNIVSYGERWDFNGFTNSTPTFAASGFVYLMQQNITDWVMGPQLNISTLGSNGLKIGSWSTASANYSGLLNASGQYLIMSQSGANPHTYVGAAAGGSTYIRSSNNNSNNQIVVSSTKIDITSLYTTSYGEILIGPGGTSGTAAINQTFKTDFATAAGTANVSSAYVLSSDGKYRNVLRLISSSLKSKNLIGNYEINKNDFMQIQPRLFSWKEDLTNRPRGGFILEEIETIPALHPFINLDPLGEFQSLDYGGMVAMLTGIVQKQQNTIDELSASVVALSARMS